MNPQDEALIVTQADRDAAATFYGKYLARPGEVPVEAAFRMGHVDESPLIQAFARHRLSHSTPGDAEVRSISVAEEWNVYMTEAVNNAPEPLRKLGEYLAELLDEDQWKKAERYLNGALLATPSGRAQAWLPMTDAPRDGTEVLLMHEHHGIIQGRFAPGEWSESTPVSPAEYSGAAWVLGDDLEQEEVEELPEGAPLGLRFYDGAIISWQPLPAAPPAQDQTKGEG